MNQTDVSVRQLKNQTTQILRRVKGGECLTVTKRGKPVAVLEPLTHASVPTPDSIYRSLQRQIEARTPQLRRNSGVAAQREFERVSRKIAGALPYKNWREMDRAAKGDRFFFLDSNLFIIDRFFRRDLCSTNSRIFTDTFSDNTIAGRWKEGDDDNADRGQPKCARIP